MAVTAKRRKVKTKAEPAAGAQPVIEPGKLYPLETFKEVTGFNDGAMKSARNNGLPVRYVGTRAFVYGDDFIAYTLRSTAQPPGPKPQVVEVNKLKERSNVDESVAVKNQRLKTLKQRRDLDRNTAHYWIPFSHDGAVSSPYVVTTYYRYDPAVEVPPDHQRHPAVEYPDPAEYNAAIRDVADFWIHKGAGIDTGALSVPRGTKRFYYHYDPATETPPADKMHPEVVYPHTVADREDRREAEQYDAERRKKWAIPNDTPKADLLKLRPQVGNGYWGHDSYYEYDPTCEMPPPEKRHPQFDYGPYDAMYVPHANGRAKAKRKSARSK